MESNKFDTENNAFVMLPISSYQKWFDALIKDNKDEANHIHSNACKDEADALVNSPFNFEEIAMKSSKLQNWEIFLPFHIAVGMCSKDIVRFLLDNKVDILKTDRNKSNALHACVIVAFHKPELEEKLCEMVRWLCDHVDPDLFSKLLDQEMKNGFRPLEYAAQQGCLKLMLALIEPPGYKSSTKLYGFIQQTYHDITDYETGPRQNKSPINMLPYLDENKLKQSGNADVLLNSFTVSWIDAKITSNILPVILWMLLRLTFFVSFFVIDSDVSPMEGYHGNLTSKFVCKELSLVNITSMSVRMGFFYFFFTYIIIALIMDIVEYIKHKVDGNYQKFNNIKGSKTIIANTKFYTYVNTLVLLLMLLQYIVAFMTLYGIVELSLKLVLFFNVMKTFIPLLMTWSVIYFLQLVPHLGSSILSIQGMIVDLIRFILLFIIVLLPYIHAFETFVLLNAKTGCVNDFSTVYNTFYTLFLVMLNQYDLSNVEVYNVLVLKVLHILYIFNIGILILNFLIAVMCNKASEVAANKKVMLMINQLALVVKLENQIFWYTKCIYKYLRRFGYHCEGNKVYLISTKNRIESLVTEKDVTTYKL